MSTVIPHRLMFRYAIPIPRLPRIPKKGKKLLALSEECKLPTFCELDSEPAFGDIRAAWNEKGIGFSVKVEGKKQPLFGDTNDPDESDGLQIWIDTRNTQSIHRASRFCHHFCFLPVGGGRKKDQPIAKQHPIARAKEDATICDPKKIQLSVEQLKQGYRLETWLDADMLTGFDPEANPRLGIYYCLHDVELGDQFLGVGREFPFANDPSLWATLELEQ